MAVNKWRHVRYTDDGCDIYECLSCYKEWEDRGSPKECNWRFCPLCGIEWQGEVQWDEDAKYDRKRAKEPNQFWVIEIKNHWRNFTTDWMVYRVLNRRFPASDVLRIIREIQNDEGAPDGSLKVQVRAKIGPRPDSHPSVWPYHGDKR